MRIAVVQMECQPWAIAANISKADKLIKRIAYNSVDVIVLPEMFDTGYDFSKLSTYDHSLSMKWLSNTSRQIHAIVVAGILERSGPNRVFNTMFVLGHHGEVLCKYRKRSQFPNSTEQQLLHKGSDPTYFMLEDHRFGLLVCYDIRFPELTRPYMQSLCSTLVVGAAFPLKKIDHWKLLLKARAVENQMYVIGANQAQGGNSAIIDPLGKELVCISPGEDFVATADIDIGLVQATRSAYPYFVTYQSIIEIAGITGKGRMTNDSNHITEQQSA